jgi:hypothetical protein
MNVCVFCGSGLGASAEYTEAARAIGRWLAAERHTLIYGGGNIGLMGEVADAVLSQQGEAIGVIPEFLLRREVGHTGLTRLEVVSSMHERKQRMADLSHVFLALPGGWGTLEELAEILTWRQLGLIAQPVYLVNIDRFFDPLIQQMQHMVSQGFLKPAVLGLLTVVSSTDELFNSLRGHTLR